MSLQSKPNKPATWYGLSPYTFKIPLDRHWVQKAFVSTTQTIKGQPAFVGIDCNNVDKTYPDLWANFMLHADLIDIAPELNTYFYQGGSSPLDRILVPSIMVDAAHLHATAYCMHFYDNFGHQPVQGRFQCPPKLAMHPDSVKHEVIPTVAFCAPITLHNSAETSIYHASIGRLLRALYDYVDPTSCTTASVKAIIWTWWRKAKTERSLPNKIVGLYKYLTGSSAHAVVKTELLQELCQAVSHPMLINVTQYPSIGNCSIIPKATLIEGLSLTKELINDYHSVQITAPIPNPVLQAISQKNLWEKLKILCPKGQFYTGPIYDKHGHKCTTAAEYDEAMLATRQFWFTPPVPSIHLPKTFTTVAQSTHPTIQ